MVTERGGVPSRFGPSERILELAQHKTSKTVWATTPCEPEWPISDSALRAVPSARIQYLAKHKRDFSAREGPSGRLKDDEASVFRKTRHPSSKTFQYESIVRLSTPKSRRPSFQEAGPPHTPQCETICPIWHVDPRAKSAVITPRLLQLSQPKRTHPDYRINRQSFASTVSLSSMTARVSQRLVQLSVPRLRLSNICSPLGRPEETVWTISKAARSATASARVEMLATPKRLSKDYIPPREPEWSRRNLLSA